MHSLRKPSPPWSAVSARSKEPSRRLARRSHAIQEAKHWRGCSSPATIRRSSCFGTPRGSRRKVEGDSMRRTLFFLVVAACLTRTAAAQSRFNRRLPLAPDGTIRIHNLAGIVRLHGWDRDSIAATGEVGRGSKRFFMGGDRTAVKLGIYIPNDDVTAAEPSTP